MSFAEVWMTALNFDEESKKTDGRREEKLGLSRFLLFITFILLLGFVIILSAVRELMAWFCFYFKRKFDSCLTLLDIWWGLVANITLNPELFELNFSYTAPDQNKSSQGTRHSNYNITL